MDTDELRDLKAAAYDCIANIEAWQAKLRETNQRIAALLSSAELRQAQPAEHSGEPTLVRKLECSDN